MFSIARTMAPWLLTMVALRVPLCAVEAKAPPAEKLIEQLGNNDFVQRERAARMLQARGLDVLPALRKARNHADAEVRRRVRAMIPILERAAALAPKRVTLGSEPRTLSAVLKEIEKQTGYKVKVDNSDEKTYHCFAMKEATFWEALEQIGRETNHVVSDVTDENELRLNPIKARSPFISLNGPFRLEVLRLHENRDIDFTELGKGKEKGRRDYDLSLTISVLAEPRFILATGQARVKLATDENGVSLESPAADDSPLYFCLVRELGWKKFSQSSEVSLWHSSGKARTIKLLRGVIPVQVVAKRKRIVFTDNLPKSAGVKCRLREGILQIRRIEQNDNKDLSITISLPDEIGSLWRDRIHIEDAKGNSYGDLNGCPITAAGQIMAISLTCPVSKDPKVGPPRKLIVEEWIPVRYDIPFEFKDIPLP